MKVFNFPLSARFRNQNFPNCWIGHQAANDLEYFSWPQRTPDLTLCDIFVFVYVVILKEAFYVISLWHLKHSSTS